MATEPAGDGDSFNLVGQILAGRFLIERHVAEGGFGVVHRAEQIALGRTVSLKVFKSAADGERFDEISQRTGKPLGTVATRLLRARTALRARLGRRR